MHNTTKDFGYIPYTATLERKDGPAGASCLGECQYHVQKMAVSRKRLYSEI